MNAEYRGLSLDVCRHFMPVEDVKKLLRAAAACGVNRLHWHLADDQGWRVEIRKYPRLAEVGGRRPDDPDRENADGFYTQEDIRGIVMFAEKLGIDIIPEIEVPGHASAMLAAYPEYGCRRTVLRDGRWEITGRGYDHRVLAAPGIFPNLLCAGRDDALRFLRDILDEVAELFPSPLFHIGGDEALKQHWRRCPDCQARMRAEGLRDEEELQRWLTLRAGEYLAEKGKSTIVYNDALAGGSLPPHFIVQHWLGNEAELREFLAGGGRVICSDLERFYFDYPYSAIDARRLYDMPLLPTWCEGYEDRLLGFECMLWTERVPNLDTAGRLLFPRLPAVMLRVTGDAACGSWEAWLKKLRRLREELSPLGIPWADERDWVWRDDAASAQTGSSSAALREERGLVRLEALEKLLREIDMPSPMAFSVADAAAGGLSAYAGTPASDLLPGAAEMAEQLWTALASREDGAWKRLPEEVWLDTIKCFARFTREYHKEHGAWGFDRGFWTTRQIAAKLFRLGALEYELCAREDGGRNVSLHIPSDARLEREELNASLSAARAFWEEFFPEWANAPVICDTWLLSPALEELLPEQSRIRRFRRAFRVTQCHPDSNEFLQWLFNVPLERIASVDFASLPEETSLQKNVKRALLRGVLIGSAEGTLIGAFT